MKHFISTLLICLMLPLLSFGQFAYIPQYVTGDLYLTDLTDPADPTLVGNTLSHIGASDFDQYDNLYAISDSDNNLCLIDTTDGSSTFIGGTGISLPYFVTGLAWDPTENTMYLCSYGSGNNNFYTIDLTNATITLIGSNSEGGGVVGIAFDDDGQMYAIYVGGEFYQIDKTNGAATLIGNMAPACDQGLYHGLDYSSVNQTMYMVSYTSSGSNLLFSVDLTTGLASYIGDINLWAGALAWKPVFNASFTANPLEICEGDTIQFNNNSTGNVSSWLWSFEGGIPSSSTSQNPEVSYSSEGTYDVQLIISDGTTTDTLIREDYIYVEAIPLQCNTPTGPVTTCQEQTVEYTTNSVINADNYNWIVDPDTAGTISGTDTIGTFVASTTYLGNYIVKVKAVGFCGSGTWSPDLACEIFENPVIYTLTGEGAYCEGGSGAELILDGSEIDIDYELYIDDVATGIIEPGTGNPINFGYHTDEGIYTCIADNNACLSNMFGDIWIHVEPLPGQAGTPAGPEEICNNIQTDYTTSGADDADTLIWNMDPATAGLIVGSGTTITIEWDSIFSGIVSLTVYGQNDCGNGTLSEPLEIMVFALPNPEISGSQLVCNNEEADYQTADNPGNTYQWNVTGGSIIAGSGTYQITVNWGEPGTGTIILTETSFDNCETTTDEYEVTIDECIGIDEYSTNSSVSIYPNPAYDQLNIEVKNTSEQVHHLSIYNQTGQRVLNQIFVISNTINIDISSLPAGLYLIGLTNQQDLNFSRRIIIK